MYTDSKNNEIDGEKAIINIALTEFSRLDFCIANRLIKILFDYLIRVILPLKVAIFPVIAETASTS